MNHRHELRQLATRRDLMTRRVRRWRAGLVATATATALAFTGLVSANAAPNRRTTAPTPSVGQPSSHQQQDGHDHGDAGRVRSSSHTKSTRRRVRHHHSSGQGGPAISMGGGTSQATTSGS